MDIFFNTTILINPYYYYYYLSIRYVGENKVKSVTNYSSKKKVKVTSFYILAFSGFPTFISFISFQKLKW
jgi:hypothetical protein